jgi:polysaccharide biosynthesis/export protein
MIKRILQACAMIFLVMTGVGMANGQEKPEVAAPQNNPQGHSDSEPDRSVDRPVAAERDPRYLLRPNDVIQIAFPISPEFDQIVTVQPDGYISLRVVGDVHIAGKSLPQLTEALRKAYGQFLHDPLISVELKDFEKPYFIAGGQLGKPGKYDLRGDTTVTEAVAIAGGFTEKSKHSQVVLYRRGPLGWTAAKQINVKQMLASQDLTEDLQLHPGDMIFVPQNSLSKIKQFIPNPGIGVGVTMP